MTEDVDPTHGVTAFGETAEWTGVRDRREPGDPADPRWLEMRRTMLTASEVACVLGVDARRSALNVYVEKITERAAPEIIGPEDRRFWGTVFEQPMLEAIARWYKWGYRRGGYLLRSRQHPWLGATLDAELDRGGGWIPFEGKQTEIPKGWDEEKEDLPTHVLIQAQVQLIVTGATTDLVFALLQGGRPCSIDVHASAELHDLILAEGERFTRRVADFDPPELDERHHKSDAAALKRLFPLEDGSVVALPNEALAWTARLQELSALAADIKREQESLKNHIKRALGNAKYGLLSEPVDGKSCWRWQTQPREEYVVDAGESRVLRALNKPPANAPKYLTAPAARDTLLDDISASLTTQDDDAIPAPAIRMGHLKRRRRR